jgi:hypothetical protein
MSSNKTLEERFPAVLSSAGHEFIIKASLNGRSLEMRIPKQLLKFSDTVNANPSAYAKHLLYLYAVNETLHWNILAEKLLADYNTEWASSETDKCTRGQFLMCFCNPSSMQCQVTKDDGSHMLRVVWSNPRGRNGRSLFAGHDVVVEFKFYIPLEIATIDDLNTSVNYKVPDSACTFVPVDAFLEG